MNAVRSMLLDLRAAKVCIKNGWVTILYLPLMIGIGVATKSTIAVFILLFMAIFMVSIFAAGWAFISFDKSRVLYLALPQKKADIVRGRYLLFLVSDTVSLLVCTTVTVVAGVFGVQTNGVEAVVCAFALAFILLPAIQAPVFFRFGFEKSAAFYMISIFGVLGLAWFIGTRLFTNNQIDLFMRGEAVITNELLVCLAFLLAAALCLLISYSFSLLSFAKRKI